MKILLLGATGRTGGLLLEQALGQGHEVVALVRDPGKLPAISPGLTVVRGSPERAEDVGIAMTGCEAVLVTLNNNRSSDLPWAKPISPPHLIETSVRNAVAAMQVNGARRIVILSAAGVTDSFEHASWLIRFLIRNTNVGIGSADHDGADRYIRTTDTDWTLVRPVGLSNSDKDKNLVVSYANSPKAAMMISRRHVAKFMLDSLDDSSLYGKAPVISER
jgi:uncharacterized protein YbjT (DUF2867 family)